MQDTKNLIKKRDIYYPKYIREAKTKKDYNAEKYWKQELINVTKKIERRNKNRIKNSK